ncbi:MAG: aldo/keto reductase [Candidatus Latescibacterota bacterium]
MEYRRLGKSGVVVSEVSFGGHQTGGYHGHFEVPLEERVRVIQRGLELGITYFDTTTEPEAESLSAVFGCLGGVPRGVTVASMYPDYKVQHGVVEGIEERVRAAVENRLRYFAPIDVLNLCGNGFEYSRERTLRALDALQEARAQGKVRHFGFSTHTMRYALAMIRNHPEFCLIMFPFNVVLPKIAQILFPVARQHDVAVVGMKALAARGLLNLGIDARSAGLSLPLALVKWVLQSPEVACTIPAMNSIAEVEENVAASGGVLTPAEEELLARTRAAFDEKVSTDGHWYYHRDWTRRLYGEEEDGQAQAAG